MTTETQAAATPTISQRLANHVVGLRYEDIPSTVIDQAKDHLVHHLGNALRGWPHETGQQAVAVALELSGSDGRCSILGGGRKANLLDAVFANSFLMTVGGSNDVLMPYGVNPGVVTQPVAWAVGEDTAASGRELLVALIAGYDALARVADPKWSWGADVFDRPVLYRPKHVLAQFGAAATAARMLGLSRQQMVHAFGHAGQASTSILEGSPDQLVIQHPLLARNGAVAAILAQQGIPAPPTILEGERGVFRSFFFQDTTEFIETGLAALGHEFAMVEARVSRHPASTMDVVPIELTQTLVERHSLTAGNVATIEVAIPLERQPREEVRDDTFFNPQAGRTSRMGNLRFQIAIIVADGRTDPGRFEQPPDADLLAVLNKIQLQYEPNRPLLYARVEVTTTDGKHYAAEGDTPAPVSIDWAESLDVGRDANVTEDQLSRLSDLIRNLEDVRDVTEVMTCVADTSTRTGA